MKLELMLPYYLNTSWKGKVIVRQLLVEPYTKVINYIRGRGGKYEPLVKKVRMDLT